jgi:hypothetical protein
MEFINKVKWVLGILLVFLVIIATNLIDRKNFRQIRDTVVTIYEDRLVAKEMILGMTLLIKEKELAIARNNETFNSGRNLKVNEELEELIVKFQETRLTKNEEKVFDQLKRHLQDLYVIEGNLEDDGRKNEVLSKIAIVNEDLLALSKIQMDEGKRQLAIGKKASDTVEIYTQVEFYLLIFLAIIIQLAVIYQPNSEKDGKVIQFNKGTQGKV